MSLYNFLLDTRTKEELAKLLVATAKENASLKDEAHIAQTELFWIKAAGRGDVDRTGLCTVRELLSEMRAAQSTACEMVVPLPLEGVRVNVEISVTKITPL